MTPERIEKLVQGCYASGGPDSETIRAALRQCAREAADEALERAAEWCESARLDWARRFPNGSATAYDAGRTTAFENAAIVIRVLKGNP